MDCFIFEACKAMASLNICNTISARQVFQNSPNRIPHAADTWLTMTNIRINYDTFQNSLFFHNPVFYRYCTFIAEAVTLLTKINGK